MPGDMRPIVSFDGITSFVARPEGDTAPEAVSGLQLR
jgi:hypothetical protein